MFYSVIIFLLLTLLFPRHANVMEYTHKISGLAKVPDYESQIVRGFQLLSDLVPEKFTKDGDDILICFKNDIQNIRIIIAQEQIFRLHSQDYVIEVIQEKTTTLATKPFFTHRIINLPSDVKLESRLSLAFDMGFDLQIEDSKRENNNLLVSFTNDIEFVRTQLENNYSIMLLGKIFFVEEILSPVVTFEEAKQLLNEDEPTALKILHRLADRGHEEAQYALGEFYDLGGSKCEPNKELAIRYYSLAARQGCIFSKAILECFHNEDHCAGLPVDIDSTRDLDVHSKADKPNSVVYCVKTRCESALVKEIHVEECKRAFEIADCLACLALQPSKNNYYSSAAKQIRQDDSSTQPPLFEQCQQQKKAVQNASKEARSKPLLSFMKPKTQFEACQSSMREKFEQRKAKKMLEISPPKTKETQKPNKKRKKKKKKSSIEKAAQIEMRPSGENLKIVAAQLDQEKIEKQVKEDAPTNLSDSEPNTCDIPSATRMPTPKEQALLRKPKHKKLRTKISPPPKELPVKKIFLDLFKEPDDEFEEYWCRQHISYIDEEYYDDGSTITDEELLEELASKQPFPASSKLTYAQVTKINAPPSHIEQQHATHVAQYEMVAVEMSGSFFFVKKGSEEYNVLLSRGIISDNNQ
jgi:TPR repeat protein